VLFTSYKMLQDAAGLLADELADMGLRMLVQGQGTSRKLLLEQFRTTSGRCCWGRAVSGRDRIRGDALRNVIITKLPFSVPDEPLVGGADGGDHQIGRECVHGVLRAGRGDPFEAGIRALIRSRTDRGIVVILDSRVVTRRYGRWFLKRCRRAGWW